MGSAKSKQGYRLNREDLEFLKASVPTVVELMNQNHTSQKKNLNVLLLTIIKNLSLFPKLFLMINF